MKDWSESFCEAELQLRRARDDLAGGNFRKGYTALARTIAYLEVTRMAIVAQSNCERVRITKHGVKAI